MQYSSSTDSKSRFFRLPFSQMSTDLDEIWRICRCKKYTCEFSFTVICEWAAPDRNKTTTFLFFLVMSWKFMKFLFVTWSEPEPQYGSFPVSYAQENDTWRRKAYTPKVCHHSQISRTLNLNPRKILGSMVHEVHIAITLILCHGYSNWLWSPMQWFLFSVVSIQTTTVQKITLPAQATQVRVATSRLKRDISDRIISFRLFPIPYPGYIPNFANLS